MMVTREKPEWKEKNGKGGQKMMEGDLTWVVDAQCKIQTMYYRMVGLKPV